MLRWALILNLLATGSSFGSELSQAFVNPPSDARIMMRWWWFGPMVEKRELERELRVMQQAGIGGVEIQPVYPLALPDPEHGLPLSSYLSNDFLAEVRFANSIARSLGMRVDITLGSGWPYGGPTTGIEDAAGMLRRVRVPVAPGTESLPLPALENGETFLAAFLARGNDVKQLTDIHGNRAVLPKDSATDRTALFFIASRTGQQVKRAAIGAEGFVLDHYSHHAVEEHLHDVADRLMTAFGDQPPYAVFSDSLEVYASDWAPNLLKEFRKRRGYDLLPYLPALVQDIGPKTEDIRHDWGETLTELSEENYLRPLEAWAKAHQTRFRSQTYGIPPVRLSSNKIVDLPEGEGYQWREFTPTRWATSAGHLYGRRVISSETWTWLHSPVFRATPLDLKAEADLHFLQGVNQLVGHGWPYSPPEAGEPGWRFYAAAVLNDHNPWFIVMPEICKYLQRTSYLLRQGDPVNDLAFYLPTDDAWAHFTPGHTSINEQMNSLLGPALIPQILDAGFGFDFVDDQAIRDVGLRSYRAIVIPHLQRMPRETKEVIDAFTAKGGIVLENGQQIASRLEPDFSTSDPAIGFVHRKLPAADIYFVANTSNHEVHTIAKVRLQNIIGQWWNPFNGETNGATSQPDHIAIDFAPYESRFLVFSGEAKQADESPTSHGESLDISSGWKLTFNDGQPLTLDRPRSWTEIPARGFYSGKGTYEKSVTLPEKAAGPKHIWIDFGPGSVPTERPKRLAGFSADLESPIREAALVYVNGKLAGSVWKPPFELDIARFTHVGENALRIVVANLAMNELAGASLPDYRLLNLRYGARFQQQDMQSVRPESAGILDPIQLLFQ